MVYLLLACQLVLAIILLLAATGKINRHGAISCCSPFEPSTKDVKVTVGLNNTANASSLLQRPILTTSQRCSLLQKITGRLLPVLLTVSLLTSCQTSAQSPSPTSPASSGYNATSTVTPTAQQGTILFTYHGQNGPYPIWSSDSTHMAFVSGGSVNGGGNVYVWEVAIGKFTKKLTLPLLPHNVRGEWSWSPDRSNILFASEDGKIKIWNTFTGHQLLTYDSHSTIWPIWTWASDGKRVALMNNNDTTQTVQITQIWDVVNGKELLAFSTNAQDVYNLVWSPDGRRIASLARDGTIQIFDVTTGRTLQSFHDPALDYPIWAPDGRRILSSLTDQVNSDTSLRVWDVLTGRKLLTFEGHSRPAYTAQWTPDGSRIVSASPSEVLVWNTITGHTILTIPSTSSGIAVLSPDGKHLAFINRDDKVQVWDAVTGRKLLTYSGHSAAVQAIAWSPGSQHIVSASEDGVVQVWDAITGRTLYSYHLVSSSVQNLIWSPNGKLIATSSDDSIVQVLQVG